MRRLLLFVVVLMGLTSAAATKTNVAPKGEDFYQERYRYAEPIMFVERGIEFLIFPDGSFDFNTHFEDTFAGVIYHRSSNTGRSSVNRTHGAPGTVSRVQYSEPRPRGVLIQHDRDGKVRRVGNTLINYDRIGRVTRIGTVYLRYNRGNGRLKQVGGLRVNYNGHGQIVHLSGIVNASNANCNALYGNGHTEVYDHYDEYQDAEDYYYYKQGNEVKKHKKRKR